MLLVGLDNQYYLHYLCPKVTSLILETPPINESDLLAANNHNFTALPDSIYEMTSSPIPLVWLT